MLAPPFISLNAQAGFLINDCDHPGSGRSLNPSSKILQGGFLRFIGNHPYLEMRVRNFLIILSSFFILLLAAPSCAPKYYTDHPGKVTKGYNKPPKKLKKSKARLIEHVRR